MPLDRRGIIVVPARKSKITKEVGGLGIIEHGHLSPLLSWTLPKVDDFPIWYSIKERGLGLVTGLETGMLTGTMKAW